MVLVGLATAPESLSVSGPNNIAIARGTYTEIFEIIAPSSAPAGSAVSVTIRIKNIWTASVHVAAIGVWDSEQRFITWLDYWIPAGATHSFYGSFIMPAKDVTIHAYSYYEAADGKWYSDDETEKDVKLAVAWQKLASKTITISPEVVAWQKLATKNITITPTPIPVEWVKLATKIITLTPEVEVPPEYELIQETIYPWSYIFQGDAEICTFEFKLTPEQIPAYPWLGKGIVDSFVSELEKDGSRLLELRVYEDTTPMFWTNYRVEVTATASPIAWTPIIIGVLAILFIVAIIFAIRAIDEVFFKRKALDEETKKTFSRETLTAMILDLEPEMAPETLEGKSDQELRDLLNRLLAEVAPPVEWWPLAILGGLAFLGLGGAAVAFSMAKPVGE